MSLSPLNVFCSKSLSRERTLCTLFLSVHSCKHGAKKKWQGSSLVTTVARTRLVLLVTILALIEVMLADGATETKSKPAPAKKTSNAAKAQQMSETKRTTQVQALEKARDALETAQSLEVRKSI